MKISVDSVTFGKALGLVGRAVSIRSTMPVLGCYLLQTVDNALRITATDREIAISVDIDAQVDHAGSVAVPATLLAEFVRNLPPERLSINVSEAFTSNLRCGRFTANIKGLDGYEFPITTIGQQKGRHNFSISLGVLGSMIEQTYYAASKDMSKPTLMGVEVTLKNGAITMAATDGYRLAYRWEDISCPIAAKLVIAAKTLKELTALLKEAAAESTVDVELVGDEKQPDQITFRIDGKNGINRIEMVSAVINARFPDYMAIVPKTNNTRCTVEVDALKKALKLCQLFAKESANIVRLR